MSQGNNVYEERFWAKVDKTTTPDGCWTWTGATSHGGYGIFCYKGKHTSAHRAGYDMLVEPVVDRLDIDHLCRNRLCVRPSHLEMVTHKANVLRGDTIAARNAAKTVCVNGHSYTPANTYSDPRGQRQCRACRTAADARWRTRTRGVA